MLLSPITATLTQFITSYQHHNNTHDLPLDILSFDNPLYSRLYFTLGTWFAHSFTFWSLNLLLFLCYKWNLFPKYRIQRDLPPSDLIMECLKHTLLNHFVITPILIYFAYPSFIRWGMSIEPKWPSIPIIFRDLLFAVFINDTLFYWAHRGLHHPAIYKYIHKRHHMFKSNIGIASEFAHPIEDLFANVIPTIGGCLLMGSHVYVLWLWLVIRIFETIDAHSGYSFPYSPFKIFSFQVILNIFATLIVFYFTLNHSFCLLFLLDI